MIIVYNRIETVGLRNPNLNFINTRSYLSSIKRSRFLYFQKVDPNGRPTLSAHPGKILYYLYI